MNTATLDAMLKPAFEQTAENISFNWETYSAGVESVCATPYDGFIPFTDGGFRIMALTDLSACESSGSFPGSEHIKAFLQQVIADAYADALSDFIEANPEAADICGGSDNVSYHALYEASRGDLAEELSELEHTWLSEGGTFWLEMRAQYYAADNYRNQTGKDEIWLCVGVNTDFTYGRDSGLDIVRELTIPAARLTEQRARTICEALTAML